MSVPDRQLDRCGEAPEGFWDSPRLRGFLSRLEYLSDGQGDVIALRDFHTPEWNGSGWQCRAVPYAGELFLYQGEYGYAGGDKEGRKSRSGIPSAPPFCDDRKFRPPSTGMSRGGVEEVVDERLQPLMDQQAAMREARRLYEERQARERQADLERQRQTDEEQDRRRDDDLRAQGERDDEQDVDRGNLWVAVGGTGIRIDGVEKKVDRLARYVYSRKFRLEVALDVRGGAFDGTLVDKEGLFDDDGEPLLDEDGRQLRRSWHGTKVARPVRTGVTVRAGGVFGLNQRVGLSVQGGFTLLFQSHGFGLEVGAGLPIHIYRGLHLGPTVGLNLDMTDVFHELSGGHSRVSSFTVAPGARLSYVFGKIDLPVRPELFVEFNYNLGYMWSMQGVPGEGDKYPRTTVGLTLNL